MIGELIALASSVVIASGVIISKKLTVRVTALPLQTMRCWFGAIFMLIVLFIMGRGGELMHIRFNNNGLDGRVYFDWYPTLFWRNRPYCGVLIRHLQGGIMKGRAKSND